jgi:hypothetical protein
MTDTNFFPFPEQLIEQGTAVPVHRTVKTQGHGHEVLCILDVGIRQVTEAGRWCESEVS